jgi:hypothetical protein
VVAVVLVRVRSRESAQVDARLQHARAQTVATMAESDGRTIGKWSDGESAVTSDAVACVRDCPIVQKNSCSVPV